MPHGTADITLIAGILCLNNVLPFLQSKWTALHVLFFSNSVIMVPKQTHINSHNLVPWTLRTLTEHWTPTLRSCQEQYEPYQNFLTAVCFPGCLFLLNVNHASSQKKISFVSYFCPVLIQWWFNIFQVHFSHYTILFTEFLYAQLEMLDIFGTPLSFFIRHTKYNHHLRTVWGTSYLYLK